MHWRGPRVRPETVAGRLDPTGPGVPCRALDFFLDTEIAPLRRYLESKNGSVEKSGDP